MKFRKGQKVKFSMYDNLFKDYIVATGILITKIYGKLWLLSPDKHTRLSGKMMQIHESWIMADTEKFIDPVSLLPKHKFLWLQRRFRKLSIRIERQEKAAKQIKPSKRSLLDKFWLSYFWLKVKLNA